MNRLLSNPNSRISTASQTSKRVSFGDVEPTSSEHKHPPRASNTKSVSGSSFSSRPVTTEPIAKGRDDDDYEETKHGTEQVDESEAEDDEFDEDQAKATSGDREDDDNNDASDDNEEEESNDVGSTRSRSPTTPRSGRKRGLSTSSGNILSRVWNAVVLGLKWLFSVQASGSPAMVLVDWLSFIARGTRFVIEWINPIEWVFYYLRKHIGPRHYLVVYLRCIYSAVFAYYTFKIINVNVYVARLIALPLVAVALGELLLFINSYRQRKQFEPYTVVADNEEPLVHRKRGSKMSTKPKKHLDGNVVKNTVVSDSEASDKDVADDADTKRKQPHDADEEHDLHHESQRTNRRRNVTRSTPVRRRTESPV